MARGAAAAYYLQLAVVHDASAQALLLVLFLLLLLIIIIHISLSSSGRSSTLQLPPSPPGTLPVIGHLHLVGDQPHVSLRDLAARHGGRDGLVLLRFGAVPTLVVSSPRAAEAVLRTHDRAFASRPRSEAAGIIRHGPSDIAFSPYGEYWRQARTLVTTRMLSAGKVRSFRHARHQEARLVISRIRETMAAAAPGTAAVDMSELLSGYTSDVVCRAVLGDSHREGGRNRLFRELIEINVSLLGGFNLEDYFPRLARLPLLNGVICAEAKRVCKRWDDLFDKLIDEHQHSSKSEEESTPDLMHVLLGVQEEYGLTRGNVKAILMDMFEAGIETSYLVLEYAMAELMNNRHIMAKLQKEVRMCASLAKMLDIIREEDLGSMANLKATVKETLRLHPPAPFLLPHLSTADCEVNGYLIPSGTRVIVNAWALGRDPTSWERAEKFMPERFLEQGSAAGVDMKGKDLQFVPFGSGRRICPGMNFGIATVDIMLANLIYHFDWELQNEVEGTGIGVDMTELFGLTLRRKEKLLLVPKIP